MVSSPNNDNAMLFARFALDRVPDLLSLQDRAPHSPTRGCFDPHYWHSRRTDCPNGGRQELVWPLALSWALDIPGNPYFRQPVVYDAVQAGIRFIATSSHADGSCDERYPHDRSLRASALSLLGCIEACELTGIGELGLADLLYRRADWLARGHQSPGHKSGSEKALVALALLRCDLFTGSNRWLDAADALVTEVLSWQSPEGWFPENDGLDPALHSHCVWLLSLFQAYRDDPRLQQALSKAVVLAGKLMHPDGSCSGEYASAGGRLFYPHGFELQGKQGLAAVDINTQFARALSSGRYREPRDDARFGHDLAAMLLTWRDWQETRPPSTTGREQERLWLPEAGLLIESRGDAKLYAGLRRGACFQLYHEDEAVHIDTQLFVQVHAGRRLRAASAARQGRPGIELKSEYAEVEGRLAWIRNSPLSPLRMLLLRLVMMSLARLFPATAKNLIGRLLARRRHPAPLHFRRRFSWLDDGRLRVQDRITAEDWSSVVSVGTGSGPAEFCAGEPSAAALEPWLDLTAEAVSLEPGEALIVERDF